MRPPLPSDPDAPATEEELREAEALRMALGDASVPHEAASLARAIVLAHAPRPLDEEVNRALVEAAVRVPTVVVRPRRAARTFGWVSAGAGTLAMAAAVLLMLRAQPDGITTQVIPLREARSTQALFREPFAEHGGESRRIDRIASARASDLRDNRFARWSVQ
jgi:hypothetical protein